MTRMTKDEVYMFMATALSKRSTCLDKQVGCIIINSNNEVIASGYNGAPRGFEHCIDLGHCKKDIDDICPSAHAEQNALLQCRVPEQIHTVYTTLSPCINCTRILLNTPCERIVFKHEHLHPDAEILWRSNKRRWDKYGIRKNV